MAHAEASARTVDAAVTAAAAQLGLRPDQVDFEVLEDPVPSTFGYIGTPARVRVTPRPGPAHEAGSEGSIPPPGTEEPSPSLGSAGATSPLRAGGSASNPAEGLGAGVVDPTLARASNDGSDAKRRPEDSNQTNAPEPMDASDASGEDGSGVEPAMASSSMIGSDADAGSDEFASSFAASELASSAGASNTTTAAARPAPTTPPSSALQSPGNGDQAVGGAPTTASSDPTASLAAPGPPNPEPSSTVRPRRRTYRDEPVDPAMIEADTERAGDFLEGLLDALDIDGDITTWVDEVGGHVELEGSDLEGLVGSNGETLDALQELTRLAVLRQSKRRVRLLLDINGFRARQREQLVAIVKATAEQVIRTREDYEFQPMTPAERKIVHDAVAAIDGARTESLGEDPHRRVVIRPA